MSAPAVLWGQGWVDADDSTLLALVRDGNAEAYAELWRRHLPAAYGVAHRYRGRTSAEDVVAEASLRVYDLIRAGKGPLTNFRSYFLSAVRTIAVDHARGDLRAVPTEDASLEAAAPATAAYDPSPSVDHALVRAAFARLAERDQQVLWQHRGRGHDACRRRRCHGADRQRRERHRAAGAGQPAGEVPRRPRRPRDQPGPRRGVPHGLWPRWGASCVASFQSDSVPGSRSTSVPVGTPKAWLMRWPRSTEPCRLSWCRSSSSLEHPWRVPGLVLRARPVPRVRPVVAPAKRARPPSRPPWS
jgi:RNA polymerase sigma factor (sigma-70 family)